MGILLTVMSQPVAALHYPVAPLAETQPGMTASQGNPYYAPFLEARDASTTKFDANSSTLLWLHREQNGKLTWGDAALEQNAPTEKPAPAPAIAPPVIEEPPSQIAEDKGAESTQTVPATLSPEPPDMPDQPKGILTGGIQTGREQVKVQAVAPVPAASATSAPEIAPLASEIQVEGPLLPMPLGIETRPTIAIDEPPTPSPKPRHHPLLEGPALASFVSFKDNAPRLISDWDWAQCCTQDLALPGLGTQWRATLQQPAQSSMIATQGQGQGLNQWYLRNGEQNNPTRLSLTDGLQVASADQADIPLPMPALLLGSGLLLMLGWRRWRTHTR